MGERDAGETEGDVLGDGDEAFAFYGGAPYLLLRRMNSRYGALMMMG